MKSVRRVAALFLSACLFVIAAACGESGGKRAEREAVAKEEEQPGEEAHAAGIVAELRQAYGADDTWKQASFAWTADLQERLIRPDRRPIAGLARLSDVEKAGDSYVVHLMPHTWYEGPPVEFILKCPRPKESRVSPGSPVSPLFSEAIRSLGYPEYAFVAKINRVRRSDAAVVDTLGERKELLIDKRPRWVAEGECLALREVPPAPKSKKEAIKKSQREINRESVIKK